MNDHRIQPLGENALTISFGNELSPELNERVIQLAEHIENIHDRGIIECVPAYSSLTIFYDLLIMKSTSTEHESAFEGCKHLVENVSENLENVAKKESRVVEVPASFNSKHGLDIDYVSSENDISRETVIEIFTSATYRVYMLGFFPGFAYMGKLDERIATSRKESPRKLVPKGSIGIAGNQTGIYPLESPGGWQIIGKTDLELFTPEKDDLTFFKPGDHVKFVSA